MGKLFQWSNLCYNDEGLLGMRGVDMKTEHQMPEFMKNHYTLKAEEVLQKKKATLFFKRLFDICLSLILLVILSPVFLVLSICIKLEDGGPIFYRQQRITTYGRVFRIFKFRTMVMNADKMGPLVTQDNDSRITKIGRKIRSFRLDEVPQLINVLIGDMSFVGTRPEVQKYVDAYSEEMMVTLLLPAGITSKSSIEFRNEADKISKWMGQGLTADEAYIQKILPEKMQYNIDYIEEVSVAQDIKVMLQTVFAVLK